MLTMTSIFSFSFLIFVDFFFFFFFFFNDTATTEIYTLSLHDALPISRRVLPGKGILPVRAPRANMAALTKARSEEHTSELQSRRDLVCRLLLEKKKKKKKKNKKHEKKKQKIKRAVIQNNNKQNKKTKQ